MSDLRERVLREAANHYYDGSPKRANTPLTDALVALYEAVGAFYASTNYTDDALAEAAIEAARDRITELMGEEHE